MISRTFARPPDASLVQTVKEVAALVPELKRTYIYSHEHQMFGRAIANAEFNAPQHRDALNAAGVRLAKLLVEDQSRRTVQKLFRERTLISPISSVRQRIKRAFRNHCGRPRKSKADLDFQGARES